MFNKDSEIIKELLAIIKSQQEFIAKNIKERVVYVDKDSGYTNADRFDESDEKEEDEFPDEIKEAVEMDMTPEQLAEQMEGKNNQQGKDNESVDERKN